MNGWSVAGWGFVMVNVVLGGVSYRVNARHSKALRAWFGAAVEDAQAGTMPRAPKDDPEVARWSALTERLNRIMFVVFGCAMVCVLLGLITG